MTKVRHVRNSVCLFHRDVDRLQGSEKGDFDLTIVGKAWLRICSVLKDDLRHLQLVLRKAKHQDSGKQYRENKSYL